MPTLTLGKRCTVVEDTEEVIRRELVSAARLSIRRRQHRTMLDDINLQLARSAPCDMWLRAPSRGNLAKSLSNLTTDRPALTHQTKFGHSVNQGAHRGFFWSANLINDVVWGLDRKFAGALNIAH